MIFGLWIETLLTIKTYPAKKIWTAYIGLLPTLEGANIGFDTVVRRRCHMIIFVWLLLLLTDTLINFNGKKKKTFNWIDISRTGTILYRRAYGIDANTFWKLYRTIYKQLHCNQFSSSLLKEKWRKGACNSLMQSPTRLSFDIRYFMRGSTYFINNKTTITTITTNAVC